MVIVDTRMSANAVLRILLAVCALCMVRKVSAGPTVVSLPSYNIEIEGVNGQSTFLDHNILSGINETVDPCQNAYPSKCNDDGNFLSPSYFKNVYSHIREHLINVLSSNPSENEIESLSVEKKLFQGCMELGSKQDEESKSRTKNFAQKLLSSFSTSDSWQVIEAGLNNLGLPNTFFDFAIEDDPANEHDNMIVLQPPSLNQIKNVLTLLDKAFKNYLKKDNDDDYVWDIYNSFNYSKKRLVLEFFEKWLEAFSLDDNEKSETVKVSIQNWNDLWEEKSYSTTGNIDWTNLISLRFKAIAHVDGQKMILVKNKSYFMKLTNVLSQTDDITIATAMKMKIITENLRYIDWKKAESLQHVKRSTFCFEDTKLYGASFRMLRDLKNFESNQPEHFKIVKAMLHHIAQITNHEIAQSKTLSVTEKKYLQHELKSITTDVINHRKHVDRISDYYDNLVLTPSYFVNIIQYRRLVKDNELSYLDARIYQDMKALPFSITDLEKARNRFILSVFVYTYSPFLESMPKEVHYATSGVKVASTLYGLLNEDKYNNVVERKNTDWFSHPVYSHEALKCFIPEHLGDFGKAKATNTITELFGVRIAFKAMLQEYHSIGIRQFYYNSKTSDVIVTADQLFFITYSKFHCHSGEKVVNAVLENSNEFYSAFNCYERNAYQQPCHLRGFQTRGTALWSSQ